MKIITKIELDPGCFLYMTESDTFENGTDLWWYIGSAEDRRPSGRGRDFVRVSDDIALSLFSLRLTKGCDPLREDFDSEDWKTECVARYERWIDGSLEGAGS